MVRGIEKFKEYFAPYSDSYVIIGGTACDIVISEFGFRPRASKDIDIILLIEALNADFARQFWSFVTEGGYHIREKSTRDRQYYRFMKPTKDEFPFQLELFSRVPDILDISDGSRFAPIPIDDEITSLSAILMNDDYYFFTKTHCKLHDQINIAGIEALICLKARAFLDLKQAKDQGENIDKDKINKHKTDIFRLALFLTPENRFEIPESIKNDLLQFTKTIVLDLPDDRIFKEMGLRSVKADKILQQLMISFKLVGDSS